MSCSQSTGGIEAVALDLPDPQRMILRGMIASCLGGVSGDLQRPEQPPDPPRARREARAFKRLLAALDRGAIGLPDDAAREAVAVMVPAIEENTDYRKIVAEHDALCGLLNLLAGANAERA